MGKIMVESWELVSDGEVLGVLTLDHVDQPFFHCHFRPSELFGKVASLFATELQSLNAGDMDRWEQDYQRIEALRLKLIPIHGAAPIDEFLLHIEGDTAWFRC